MCINIHQGRIGIRLFEAELSHSGTAVQTAGTVVSGHSAIDHASDSFPDKTGYSPLGGTKLWVKDRFRTVRRGTSDPLRTFKDSERSGHWAEVGAGFRGLLMLG